MSNALREHTRLYIPKRDLTKNSKPRPAISDDCCHADQVRNAFDFCYSRYKKAMDDLAKL